MTSQRRSTMSLRAWVGESVDGIFRRRLRSLLTILGVALGVGAFVSVLGLTTTANSQIDATFTASEATVVRVSHAAGSPGKPFPREAEDRVGRLNGVTAVGRFWSTSASFNVLPAVPGPSPIEPSLTDRVRVSAASPGFWKASAATLSVGRTFDEALYKTPVAVVGARVADAFNLSIEGSRSWIYIDNHPVRIIGIVTGAAHEYVTATSVVLPDGYARASFGGTGSTDQLLVTTRLGAGTQVAQEAPLAIDARNAANYQAQYPPPPTVVADAVSDDLRVLFLALAGVCVVIGTVGIVNVNLLAAYERIAEVGLRMSVGARPRHILAQFLAEAGMLGLAGGLLGGLVGQLVILGVSIANYWSPASDSWVLLASGPTGCMIGIISGAYPAWRASRFDPVVALRR